METKITTKRLSKWVTIAVVLLFISSLGAWFFGRDTMPRVIRVGTGEEGGLYQKIGEAIQAGLENRVSSKVIIESTEGSLDNYQKVLEGEMELGIVQGGSVPLQQLSVVTPLFPDYVFVIVRKDGPIKAIPDLVGHQISLGLPGSGSRISALQVLAHFDIQADDLGNRKNYFTELLVDPDLDGAIMTTGIGNPDLRKLLSTNQFILLPVLNAEAIELAHPFFHTAEIPSGFFGERVSIPKEPTVTVTTNAFLVARDSASREMIREILAVIHEGNLKMDVPTLISRDDVNSRISTQLHPAALEYFNPSDNIGWLREILESMNSAKELIVALGTGIYLVWRRWRQLKEEEIQEAFHKQRDRLDWFLSQTLLVEQQQMDTTDVDELQEYLDKVTTIKLQALQELTEAEMRSDQAFSIFLDQCAGLINKIQLKILGHHAE